MKASSGGKSTRPGVGEGSMSSPLYLFYNCRLFRNGRLQKDELWVSCGKVVDPSRGGLRRRADERVDCRGAIISPGFIDLQVNGAFGADFLNCENDASALAEGVRTVRRKLPETGVTSFLPTVITASAEMYEAALPYLHRVEGSAADGAGILGFHAEGPFLSREKKGAHSEEYIVPLRGDFSVVENMYGTRNLEHMAMITIAPENADMKLIKLLRRRGIVVSMGHSIADMSIAEEAVAAGASKITHLFNAMHCFHHRNPSLPGLLVSESAEQRDLFFGIIADGIHAHPSALKIAYRVHQKGLILVTDAMAAMGLPPGEYKLGGSVEVVVKEKPDRAILKTSDKPGVSSEDEVLAGAIKPLDFCIRHFYQTTHCTVEEALGAATITPARCLGIQAKKGTLAFGSDADFVLLDDQLNVLATYIGGGLAFKSRKSFVRAEKVAAAAARSKSRPAPTELPPAEALQRSSSVSSNCSTSSTAEGTASTSPAPPSETAPGELSSQKVVA